MKTTTRYATLAVLAVIIGSTAVTAQAAGKQLTEQPKRPNILFAIADDASQPYFGAYGCNWVRTPSFDRVAENGILFNNAYTPNAKCAPSRACILTGRNTWQLEEACNHVPEFPPKFKSFMEALPENGVFVGSTAKGWAPGRAIDVDGNRRLMTGPKFDKRTRTPPASGITNNDYAANFVDFLDANTEDRPWCFWYGSVEPHRGYEYGSGAAKGGLKTDAIDRVPAFWPDNETIRNDMLDYAFELEHFDTHLGRMIETLKQRGELDNTLIVVTADNGMPFPRIKGQEYEMSNHLPLAVMWPDGINTPGRKVDDYISFADFAPTFVELLGLDWDAIGMQPAAGRSMVPLLASDKSGQIDPSRDFVLFGKERHDIGRPDDQGYPIRAMVRDDMIYIKNFEPTRWPAGDPATGYLNCDGSPTKTLILDMRRSGENTEYWQQSFGRRPLEELYNIKKDPECMNNLAENPEYRELKAKMQQKLFEKLTEQGDPRMAGNGQLFDNYEYVDRNTQNYYNRMMSGEEVRAGWTAPSDRESEPVE